MLLNNEQIESLLDIIDYFTTFYIGKHIGGDVLTKRDKNILTKFGVDYKKFSQSISTVESAFKFGMLAAALGKSKVKGMRFVDLKRYIKSGKFIPLSAAEKYALDFVKRQVYNDIKGLGNRIAKDTLQVFIESSKTRRNQYQKQIKTAVKQAILDRSTVKELSLNLGHKIKDWSRDFDRIADYVMHDAYQQGIATQLLKENGEDAEVFFTVYSGACEHCKATYILDEDTGEPKVFKLKDVIANGSNIGRKAEDWLPSVSPLHPWCRCTMHLKPANTVWSAEEKMFVLKRNDYGVKRKSKIKVTITKEI